MSYNLVNCYWILVLKKKSFGKYFKIHLWSNRRGKDRFWNLSSVKFYIVFKIYHPYIKCVYRWNYFSLERFWNSSLNKSFFVLTAIYQFGRSTPRIGTCAHSSNLSDDFPLVVAAFYIRSQCEYIIVKRRTYTVRIVLINKRFYWNIMI